MVDTHSDKKPEISPTGKKKDKVANETQEILNFFHNKIKDTSAPHDPQSEIIHREESESKETDKHDGESGKNLRTHLVTMNDTLNSLAFQYSIRFHLNSGTKFWPKLSCSPEVIKQANNFSGDMIYPGQTIKIPVKENIPENFEHEGHENELIHNESIQQPKPTLTKPGKEEHVSIHKSIWVHVFLVNSLSKGEAYYITPVGEIEGTLTITSYMVMFDPNIFSDENRRIIKSNVLQARAERPYATWL